MATNTQDVELRIRASNYSKQTTDKVVEALKELEKAQQAQIESAKKGTVTIAQLEAGYTKLENAAKALLSQQGLTKLFQSQTATLTELEAKLAAARKAQTDYANSLTAGEARTAKQDKAMKDLARTVASVEKQFERAQVRVDTTGKRLAEFGINASNLAAAQQKITTAVTSANEALARQEKAINGADTAAAQRKAAADMIAQRELQIRVDNQFAQAERDLARSIEAERLAQIANNQAAAENMRARQADADIVFTNAERVAAEAIAKKTAALQAQQTALRAAADAAERLARTNSAGARGANGAQPVLGPQLAGTIRDIQNPAEAATRSITGIETAIAGLERRVASIRGPVQDYRGAVDEATRAQRALLTVAGQVDAYQRQLIALRASRAEFQAARTAVNALIAEMRSGAAGDDITTRLARAQATLQQTAAQMANVTNATRASREALRTAGVDTTNLTNSEAALVAQANRAAGALTALTGAFQRNGAAADQAGSRIANWFGGAGGRTTLSYTQRLRGEMLGLAAGFVGLNAVINVAKGSLESYSTNQAIMSRLLISNGGDAVKAGDDFKYLQAQADKIGFVFQKVAPAFTKFAIAAKSANFSTQETRFVFEKIATSAVKARLSTDELGGVMKAFEQIMSKGTVQAEELRGQLGDRLPGAFQIAARAADMTVEQYTKALTLGEIGSEQVVAIARELGKTYGAAAEGAGGLLEAQARFQNAQDRFLSSTAEGGFADAYTKFLTKLTNLLNSGEGDKLAQQLSAGFSSVIEVMGFLADNLGTLKTLLVAIIGLSFVKWLVSLPALFRLVRVEVGLLNAQMLLMNTRMSQVAIVNGITSALGAAGLSGVAARLAPLIGNVALALRGLALAIPVVGAALAAYYATTAILDSVDDKVRNRITGSFKATQKAVDDATRAESDLRDARGTADEKKAQEHYDKMRDIAVKATKAQGAAVAEAREKGISLIPIKAEAEEALRNSQKNPLDLETADPGTNSRGVQKAFNKELEADAKRTTKALRATRMKSAKEELQDRLDIVDETYEALREKYKKSFKDEKERADAIAKIDKASLAAQAVERAKFANEQQQQHKGDGDKRIKLAEDIKTQLNAIEDDIASKSAAADVTEPFEKRRLARVEAIGNAYDKLNAKILQEKKLSPKQGAEDEKKLKILTKQRMDLESQNATRDEANRLVEEFNKQQGIMKDQLDEIDALFKSNMISRNEMLTRTNEITAVSGDAVQEAGQAALDFANKFRAMLDPATFQKSVAAVRAGMADAQVDTKIAGNDLAAQQETMNQILADQARAVELITLKRQLGMISSEEEAALLNQNSTQFNEKIIQNAESLLQLLQVARDFGAISQEAFDKAKAGAENLVLSTKKSQIATTDLEKTIASSISNNATTAFSTLADEIAKVATGAQSIGDGFRGALRAIGTFFAQLLRDIAMAIIKQQILNAISKFGGGIGAAGVALGGAIAGSGAHNGGVIGGSSTTFTRRVDAAAYFNAPRYHTGGLAGFAPNEVPAILQKNEEVLTRDDPRHVLNGGAAGGGTGGDGGTRFVLVDDRKNVPEAMASSAGEKVTLMHLKANLPTIRSWMK